MSYFYLDPQHLTLSGVKSAPSGTILTSLKIEVNRFELCVSQVGVNSSDLEMCVFVDGKSVTEPVQVSDFKEVVDLVAKLEQIK
jgi:hypothetical protein|tara:strand:+ start:956 stop:1207 length:252 start_codon:yes stop_codon:yes gene_type:complete